MASPDEDPYDWKEIMKRATAYAYRRLYGAGNMDVAERLAHDSLKTYFRDGGPAAGATEQDILWRLGSIINGLAINYRRSKAEVAMDGFSELDEAHPAPSTARLDDRLDGARAIDLLLRRVDSDPLLEQMIMLHLEDIWEPQEIAAKLNRGVMEIYNANRRLRDHYAAVREHLMEPGHDEEA